jgi:hypothetical protein
MSRLISHRSVDARPTRVSSTGRSVRQSPLGRTVGSRITPPSRGIGNRAICNLVTPAPLKVLPSANAELSDAPFLPPPARAFLAGSTGSPIEASVRSEMEGALGYDFGAVRLHTGPEAAKSAKALNACAYVVGRDVVMGSVDGTASRQRLLAHELVHTIQQAPGRNRGPALSPSTVSERIAVRASSRLDSAAIVPGSIGVGLYRQSLHAVRDLGDASLVREITLVIERLRPQVLSEDTRAQGEAYLHELIAAFVGRIRSSPRIARHSHLLVKASEVLGETPADPVLRSWLGRGSSGEGNTGSRHQPPRFAASHPAEVLRTGAQAVRPQTKAITVVDFFPPPSRIAIGDFRTTTLSQAEIVEVSQRAITEPDPVAGYEFDTYLVNISTGEHIAATHLNGTRYRVFAGSKNCPGCHFGQGLEIDLYGESYLLVQGARFLDARLGRPRGPTPSQTRGLAMNRSPRPPTRVVASRELRILVPSDQSAALIAPRSSRLSPDPFLPTQVPSTPNYRIKDVELAQSSSARRRAEDRHRVRETAVTPSGEPVSLRPSQRATVAGSSKHGVVQDRVNSHDLEIRSVEHVVTGTSSGKSSRQIATKPTQPKKARPKTKPNTDTTKVRQQLTREQQRRLEIVEEFGGDPARSVSRAERQTEAARAAGEPRTKNQQKTSHRDPFVDAKGRRRRAGHHGFPQYLGGKYEQTLLRLPEDLHYLYHQELDRIVKVPRRAGSRFYRELSQQKRTDMLERVIEHAGQFDQRYGTKIQGALLKGIEEANL